MNLPIPPRSCPPVRPRPRALLVRAWRIWRLRIWALLVGSIVALQLPPAQAQSASEKATAEALFREGQRLLDAGKLEAACEKLQASQELDSGVGTLLYLGDCLERSGRTASAWATFNEAASLAGANNQVERKQLATTRAQALEPKLVRLSIEIDPRNLELPDFELRSNGEVVPPATAGVGIPVDPGERHLLATATGYRPYRETLMLTEGSNTAQIPALVPLPESSTAAPSSPEEGRSQPGHPLGSRDSAGRDHSARAQRTIGMASVGLGAVGVALGTTFGVMALRKNSESEEECRPEDARRCTSEGVALRSDARRAANLSTGSLIAGGALVAGGLAVYLTAPRDRQRHLATLTPTVSHRQWGVTLGGRW